MPCTLARHACGQRGKDDRCAAVQPPDSYRRASSPLTPCGCRPFHGHAQHLRDRRICLHLFGRLRPCRGVVLRRQWPAPSPPGCGAHLGCAPVFGMHGPLTPPRPFAVGLQVSGDVLVEPLSSEDHQPQRRRRRCRGAAGGPPAAAGRGVLGPAPLDHKRPRMILNPVGAGMTAARG